MPTPRHQVPAGTSRQHAEHEFNFAGPAQPRHIKSKGSTWISTLHNGQIFIALPTAYLARREVRFAQRQASKHGTVHTKLSLNGIFAMPTTALINL